MVISSNYSLCISSSSSSSNNSSSSNSSSSSSSSKSFISRCHVYRVIFNGTSIISTLTQLGNEDKIYTSKQYINRKKKLIT